MNEAILYLYAADVVGGLNIVSSMFFFAFVLAGGVLSCFYGATLMEASALKEPPELTEEERRLFGRVSTEVLRDRP